MSTIPLTDDGGLDPRLTYCPRCGCDTNEIIVGDNRLLTHNWTGQQAIAPRDRVRKVAKFLGWAIKDYKVENVPAGKLPGTSLCDSCKEETDEFEKIVAAGGIYFRCTSCNKAGVIAKSEYADIVRSASGKDAPEPCGVEFTDCAEHQGMSL